MSLIHHWTNFGDQKLSCWSEPCRMRGSTYSPKQHVDRRKALSVVLSKLYGLTNNGNACTSTYGLWNHGCGCRGNELWDDVLLQRSRRGNGVRCHASQKRIINQPVSGETTPKRQLRFKALAAPKKSGCGPNCKKSRCAATVEYAKPHCIVSNHKDRKGEKRPRTSVFQRGGRNIHTIMANTCVPDRSRECEDYDMTLGLKNLKKVNEFGDLEDFPTGEQNCERNCGECSDALEDATTNDPESRSGTHGNEMKSSTTRTVGSNTEKYCARVDYDIPVRVLKSVDNNIMSESLQNATIPIRRANPPRPIPRVALLKPPQPKPYKHLNKMAKKMMKYAVERQPLSLTSRRIAPQKLLPQTQKLMPPGKLAPRLLIPPTSIPFTRTPTPRSPSTKREKPQPKTELQPPRSTQNPSVNEISSNQSSKRSSTQSSKQSSKADSLITPTEFDTSSSSSRCTINEHSNKDSTTKPLTPTYCVCRLCGKSESITEYSQLNSSVAYNNNPMCRWMPLEFCIQYVHICIFFNTCYNKKEHSLKPQNICMACKSSYELAWLEFISLKCFSHM